VFTTQFPGAFTAHLLVGIMTLAVMGCHNSANQCGGNIPQHPALNSFALTYDPHKSCADFPLIDAFIKGANGRDGRYAASQAEHDEGLRVRPSDTITVGIYFDNGGADTPQFTAKNVRALFAISPEVGIDHRISAQLLADNAQSINSRSRGGDLFIHSSVPTRLEYVTGTTTLCISRKEAIDRGFESTETCGTNDVGVLVSLPDQNMPTVIPIGDLAPGFVHSGTIGFALRVVADSTSPTNRH
jgi:hypothetical protein